MSNRDIANIVKCSLTTVKQARKALHDGNISTRGIASAKCRELLMQYPDRDSAWIAKEVGCTVRLVQKLRKNIDINPNIVQHNVGVKNTLDNADVDINDSWIHNSDYYFDEGNDTYVVSISKTSKPLIIAGETMRNMRKDYSDIDGSHLNINEICVKYSIPRSWFIELKTKMGWTHTDITFTDEEVKSKNVDTLVAEALENKKRAFINRYQRHHLDDIKTDAKKWRDFEFGILNPFNSVTATPIEYKPKMFNIANGANQYDMLVVIADDHFGYGKDSHRVMNNMPYDTETASQRMQHIGEIILSDCVELKVKPNTVSLLSMGDSHDSETDEATAKGTPRPQIDTMENIWLASTKSHSDLTLNLKRITKYVARYNIVGNHSPFIDFALETYIKATLATVDGIVINPNDKPAVSFVINNSQIVGHHGKGLSPTKTSFGSEKELKGSLMFTNWFKDDFMRSKYHDLFLAHVHHRVNSELSQYKLHVVPSILGNDTYSDSLLVQSEPGAMYYLIDNNGIVFERFIKL
jgi:hypothetical protein